MQQILAFVSVNCEFNKPSKIRLYRNRQNFSLNQIKGLVGKRTTSKVYFALFKFLNSFFSRSTDRIVRLFLRAKVRLM